MTQATLLARIESVGFVELGFVGLRQVTTGSDPRSGVGARIHGGRWNQPDSFSTLYLALAHDTVIAEWQRTAARQGVALEDFLPRDLYEFDVRLQRVLDLRGETTRDAIGITLAEIHATDQAACQRVGEAAHALVAEGVVAPSATRIGEVAAVLLDRLEPGSEFDAHFVETWTTPP